MAKKSKDWDDESDKKEQKAIEKSEKRLEEIQKKTQDPDERILRWINKDKG